MTTFELADRVFITAQYPDPELHGCKGTVVRIVDGDFPYVVNVKFRNQYEEFYFFPDELILEIVEIPYDPEQQGDLEEDI